jgi:hypothetical protein
MTQKELENALPETHNIRAIVVFRLCEDAPFVCVATFLAPADAEVFLEHVHPAFGIGQYQLLTVSESKDAD